MAVQQIVEALNQAEVTYTEGAGATADAQTELSLGTYEAITKGVDTVETNLGMITTKTRELTGLIAITGEQIDTLTEVATGRRDSTGGKLMELFGAYSDKVREGNDTVDTALQGGTTAQPQISAMKEAGGEMTNEGETLRGGATELKIALDGLITALTEARAKVTTATENASVVETSLKDASGATAEAKTKATDATGHAVEVNTEAGKVPELVGEYVDPKNTYVATLVSG